MSKNVQLRHIVVRTDLFSIGYCVRWSINPTVTHFVFKADYGGKMTENDGENSLECLEMIKII